MRRPALLLVACCLLLSACGDDPDTGGAAEPSPSASFPFATALLDNGDESTLVTVEVAETPEQRELGLAGRASLEDDFGMAFVFFEERETGLDMEGVTIPLSVAYFDAEGTILEIMDMEPCGSAPCETYDPGVAYMAALQVNQGSFEEWDISEGDVIHLTR
jgi:hypothetical protein